MNVKVLAPAKINLGLEILGKRADGYHEIDTIMQSIDLCDEIDVKISNDKSTEVLCNKNIGCISENNIVYKAAKIFFEYIGIKNPGVKIKIKKRNKRAKLYETRTHQDHYHQHVYHDQVR